MGMGLFLSSAKRRVNRNAVRGAGGPRDSASDTRIQENFTFCFVLLSFALCEAQFTLRGLPAETRLTVYRWLYIMRPVGRSTLLGAKLFVARRVFKRDVLVIQTSDHHHILREHIRGTKESFSRSS